jgi:haloalkane dehalogenase
MTGGAVHMVGDVALAAVPVVDVPQGSNMRTEPPGDEVQPSPEARRGVAEMPRQILAAEPLLERLSRQVPERLGDKPAVFPWGMRDLGFRPQGFLPRLRATFSDHTVVELPDARHYIQEDAPDEIARAITERFS